MCGVHIDKLAVATDRGTISDRLASRQRRNGGTACCSPDRLPLRYIAEMTSPTKTLVAAVPLTGLLIITACNAPPACRDDPGAGGQHHDIQHGCAGPNPNPIPTIRVSSCRTGPRRSPGSTDQSETPAGASSSRYCAPKRKTLGVPGSSSTPGTPPTAAKPASTHTGEPRVSQAAFVCQRCGHTAPADEHAARNILRAGLAHHARGA